jgi:hypothetical protein
MIKSLCCSFAFGPRRPSPAHPYFRLPRGLLSAYAGGFTFAFMRMTAVNFVNLNVIVNEKGLAEL